MYRRMMMLGAVALIAVGAAACSDDPSGPLQTALPDVALVALDDYGFMGGSGVHCATGPGTCFGTGAGANRSYLGTLVQQAYAKLLAEQGKEAADAAFAKLWQLHQDAFALRASDHDAFVAAMAAAHAESVKLVVSVLGTGSAATVVQLAEEKLVALQALIATQKAAGADVSRLEYVAGKAGEYLASARTALAAGDLAGALDFGSRALQAATAGGGQNARGGGLGGGRQYRGGK